MCGEEKQVREIKSRRVAAGGGYGLMVQPIVV